MYKYFCVFMYVRISATLRTKDEDLVKILVYCRSICRIYVYVSICVYICNLDIDLYCRSMCRIDIYVYHSSIDKC
jgi:hypothetical protein